MKNNSMLAAIYREIFGYELDFSSFSNRLRLQKITYLLREMGIPYANYAYRWYYRGTYSQELQNEFLGTGISDTRRIIIPDDIKPAIKRIKDIIADNEKGKFYDVDSWLEAVTSCHYLQNYMYSKENEVLEELRAYKPHLKNREGNAVAYKLSQRMSL